MSKNKSAFFKQLDQDAAQYDALASQAAWDLARDPDNKSLRTEFQRVYGLHLGMQQLRLKVIDLVHLHWIEP